MLSQILDRRRPFEDVVESTALSMILSTADERERRYGFALTRAALRHLGQIDDLIGHFLDKPLPARAGPAQHILRLALADLLFLNTEPYAAVNSAVELAAADSKARHFRGLVNAILRRAAIEAPVLLARQDIAQVLLPPWLTDGWRRAYGPTAEAIIRAHAAEPPLDLTLMPGRDPAEWADRLGAQVLPNGSLRRPRAAGPIQDLPGFGDGAFWVQDAAATLPVRLFGNIRGLRIIDLCAAPGGKTAWLAAAGARVVAVEKSAERTARLAANLKRLRLDAEIVIADARDYRPSERADAVLLDAPCTSTGTIRRHPDLPWIKEPDDIRALALLQAELLDAAFAMLKPGGILVYSVCSLEPDEGERAVAAFMEREGRAARLKIDPLELPGIAEFVTQPGDLRTLPCHWPELGGLDGFYAARIRCSGSA